MTDWINRTHIGDCRDLMRRMITDGVRVNCVVTSPPYWGLRDYGVRNAIGLEPTLQEWLERIAEVFSIVWDLLADDGVLWLNLGDAYANDGKWGGETGGKQTYLGHTNRKRVGRDKRFTGLKPKDLMGLPWRVALALQDAGWYLRSDVIWHKPNPMPESVTDRPTKSHEYVFLLSKSERYHYNAEAIAEPTSPESHARAARGRSDSHKWADGGPGDQTIAKVSPSAGRPRGVNPKASRAPAGWDIGPGDSFSAAIVSAGGNPRINASRKALRSDVESRHRSTIDGGQSLQAEPDGWRNIRTVWTIPTQPYSGAHFATFPQELVARCILAGSRPCHIVFDPFMGSGTVAQVATDLGRNFVGCELNPEYVELHDMRRTTIGMPI